MANTDTYSLRTECLLVALFFSSDKLPCVQFNQTVGVNDLSATTLSPTRTFLTHHTRICLNDLKALYLASLVQSCNLVRRRNSDGQPHAGINRSSYVPVSYIIYSLLISNFANGTSSYRSNDSRWQEDEPSESILRAYYSLFIYWSLLGSLRIVY